MSTFYGTGTHRLIYKAHNFTTGLTVTAYIWNPSLTKSALQTFTEVSDGLYYLDYAFAVAGTHFGKFYEGGVETTSGVFRVEVDLSTLLSYAVSSAAWGYINSGIVFRGVASEGTDTTFVCGGLAGQGAGAFVDANTPWYAYVFRDAGGAAAAPQGETRTVSVYTTATGAFEVSVAFSAAIAAGDDIIIMSGRLAAVPEIKAVTDAINSAQAEPGQGVPAVNATPLQKLAYLYKAWRNRKDNDGSTTQLYDDAGTTVDQKQTTSEAGGTVTKTEWASGP